MSSSEDGDGDSDGEFGLATYQKSRTQFDGVTSELQVTYLDLKQDMGVEVPILSSGRIQRNIDFSVMLWFKIN